MRRLDFARRSVASLLSSVSIRYGAGAREHCFQTDAVQLLEVAYMLLGRMDFLDILQRHAEQRTFPFCDLAAAIDS